MTDLCQRHVVRRRVQIGNLLFETLDTSDESHVCLNDSIFQVY